MQETLSPATSRKLTNMYFVCAVLVAAIHIADNVQGGVLVG